MGICENCKRKKICFNAHKNVGCKNFRAAPVTTISESVEQFAKRVGGSVSSKTATVRDGAVWDEYATTTKIEGPVVVVTRISGNTESFGLLPGCITPCFGDNVVPHPSWATRVVSSNTLRNSF